LSYLISEVRTRQWGFLLVFSITSPTTSVPKPFPLYFGAVATPLIAHRYQSVGVYVAEEIILPSF